LVSAGGVGIAKKLFVGETITATGTATAAAATADTHLATLGQAKSKQNYVHVTCLSSGVNWNDTSLVNILSITLAAGTWLCGYNMMVTIPAGYDAESVGAFTSSLSTSNSSVDTGAISGTKITSVQSISHSSTYTVPFSATGTVTIASQTTYYLNIMPPGSTALSTTPCIDTTLRDGIQDPDNLASAWAIQVA
jgi:hypothetical protein